MHQAIQHLIITPKSRCLNHILSLARKSLFPTTSQPDPPTSLTIFTQCNDFISYSTAAMRLLIWNEKTTLHAMWKHIQSKANNINTDIDIDIDDPWKSQTVNVLHQWSRNNPSLSVIQALAIIIHPPVPFLTGSIAPLPLFSPPPYHAPLTIEDYALDKHTIRGKKLGRGLNHFFQVAAQVENEAFPDPWATESIAWYLELEKNKNGPRPKSTDVMKYILRKWTGGTQKRKHDSIENKASVDDDHKESKAPLKKKPRPAEFPIELPVLPPTLEVRLDEKVTEQVEHDPFTYLDQAIFTQIPCAWKPPAKVGIWKREGDIWNGRPVFLKGPEKKEAKPMLFQWWCNEVKRCIDPKEDFLHHIPTRVLAFQQNYYVLMHDVSGGPPHRPVEPAKWKDQDIMRLAPNPNIQIAADYFKIQPDPPEAFILQYIAVLLFRNWLHISDTNHRNMAVVNDTILYSVDENRTVQRPPGSVVCHVPKAFRMKINQWIKDRNTWAQQLLTCWSTRAASLLA